MREAFSVSYVMRVTAKHMRRAIDISIRKTFERSKGFNQDSKESTEAFRALSLLHQMRAQLDAFQESNKDSFKGN